MEIKFEKIDSVYVAEFEITSNCNIHIEREDLGMFTIESRGSKSGKYVPMENGYYGDKYVIDVDMLGNIYPKYIKITSASKPTYAEVNFAEQGGGSGGIDPNDPESEYFTEYFLWSSIPTHLRDLMSQTCVLVKDSNSIMFGRNPNSWDNSTAIAIMPNYKIIYNGMYTLKEILLNTGLLETYNVFPRITKEEFYNITE